MYFFALQVFTFIILQSKNVPLLVILLEISIRVFFLQHFVNASWIFEKNIDYVATSSIHILIKLLII